jgi:hypothetical protein
MSSVQWPNPRQSRGEPSRSRSRARIRNEREPLHHDTATARAYDHSVYHAGCEARTEYDRQTDTINEIHIEDRSVTARLALRLFRRGRGLLRTASPFAEPLDIKRQSSIDKTIRLDADTKRYEFLDRK